MVAFLRFPAPSLSRQERPSPDDGGTEGRLHGSIKNNASIVGTVDLDMSDRGGTCCTENKDGDHAAAGVANALLVACVQ